MTDEQKPTSQAEASAPQEATTTSSSSAARPVTVAIVLWLLLLASIAAAGYFYLWPRWQGLNQQLSSVQQQLQQRQQYASQHSVTQLQQQLQQLQQQQSQWQQLADQQQQLSQALAAQDNSIQRVLKRLDTLTEQRPNQWRWLEAKQWISAAARALWVSHDSAAAIQWLHQADAQIASIEQPEAIAVRQDIADDIAILEALPKRDTTELQLTLRGLAKRSQQLNLVNATKATQESNQQQQTSASWGDWKTNFLSNWNAFVDQFIRIQPSTEKAKPLPSPQLLALRQQQIQSLFMLAQQAVAMEQPEVYVQALQQITELAPETFQQSAARDDLLERVNGLAKHDIVSHYPQQLQSLQRIQQLLSRGGSA